MVVSEENTCTLNLLKHFLSEALASLSEGLFVLNSLNIASGYETLKKTKQQLRGLSVFTVRCKAVPLYC